MADFPAPFTTSSPSVSVWTTSGTSSTYSPLYTNPKEVFLVITSTPSGATNIPVMSGGGATWVELARVTDSGGRMTIAFVGYNLPYVASGASSVQATWPTATTNRMMWLIRVQTAVPQTTAPSVVAQSATGTDTALSSGTGVSADGGDFALVFGVTGYSSGSALVRGGTTEPPSPALFQLVSATSTAGFGYGAAWRTSQATANHRQDMTGSTSANWSMLTMAIRFTQAALAAALIPKGRTTAALDAAVEA